MGGDVWRLEEPDYQSLVEAVRQAFQDRARLSTAARKMAETRYGFAIVLHEYLKLLCGD